MCLMVNEKVVGRCRAHIQREVSVWLIQCNNPGWKYSRFGSFYIVLSLYSPPFLFIVSSYFSFLPSFIPSVPSSLTPFVFIHLSCLLSHRLSISLSLHSSFALFSASLHLSFSSISLPPHWQRLSWPPLTRKQAQLAWQPPVVLMK